MFLSETTDIVRKSKHKRTDLIIRRVAEDNEEFEIVGEVPAVGLSSMVAVGDHWIFEGVALVLESTRVVVANGNAARVMICRDFVHGKDPIRPPLTDGLAESARLRREQAEPSMARVAFRAMDYFLERREKQIVKQVQECVLPPLPDYKFNYGKTSYLD